MLTRKDKKMASQAWVEPPLISGRMGEIIIETLYLIHQLVTDRDTKTTDLKGSF